MNEDQKNDSLEPTLKTLRESAGYTQERLAVEMELSRTTIGLYESGAKLPRVDNFLALAKKLGVSLKTLAKAMNLDISGIPDD